MLAKQTSPLILKIYIPYRLEQHKRLRLVLKILKNRQLAGFARPVNKIDFFSRIYRQPYFMRGIVYCQLLTPIFSGQLSHFL